MTTTKTSSNKAKTAPIKAATTAGKSDGNGKSAPELILQVVARAYAMGKSSLPRDRLIMGTGLKPKTVTNNLPKLKAKNLVTYSASEVSLTEEGIEAAGDAARRPSSDAEYHEILKKDLNARQIEMFDMLADGKTWNKEDLAKELGYEGAKHKTFINHIGGLSGKKIVEYPTKGQVRMSDSCFIGDRGNA